MERQKRIRLGTLRLHVPSLASLSGLRIRCCREPWCWSQTQLGSCVAVAVVEDGSYSSDSTPSLGMSICRGCSPKKTKKRKKKRKEGREERREGSRELQDHFTWSNVLTGIPERAEREKGDSKNIFIHNGQSHSFCKNAKQI